MQVPDPVVAAADLPDTPVLALMASALLGPAAWLPVQRELQARGWEVVTAPRDDEPEPVTSTDAALAYASAIPSDRRVVLVPHSNAGNFVPALSAIRSVAAVVFVDAAIPVASGIQRLAPPRLLERVERLADKDGLLPVWTDWFDGADIAELFPDPQTRFHVESQQPRLPVEFLRGEIVVDPGWDRSPCGYLAFGATYSTDILRARALSWPVIRQDGRHLHMLVDPPGVAAAVLELLRRSAPDLPHP